MKELVKFFAAIIVIFIGAALSLLYAKVVLSVATLYELQFLMNFSFVQMYGIFMVCFVFVIYGSKIKLDDEKDFEANLVETLTVSIMKALAVLLGWVMAFIMHAFLT